MYNDILKILFLYLVRVSSLTAQLHHGRIPAFAREEKGDYNKPVICPNDQTEMHRVKILSHYGQPIELEQCENCGGLWFDESELFGARQGEAEKIELLDADILRNPSLIENYRLNCPRDQTTLYRFTEKRFPEDIILERCQLCNGIWLNRGVFTKYQRFRQELLRPKEKSAEDKKLEASIRELIASHQSGRSTETLEKLGKFLSTPVDSVTPFTPVPTLVPGLAGNAASLSLNILLTLLRAFILKF